MQKFAEKKICTWPRKLTKDSIALRDEFYSFLDQLEEEGVGGGGGGRWGRGGGRCILDLISPSAFLGAGGRLSSASFSPSSCRSPFVRGGRGGEGGGDISSLSSSSFSTTFGAEEREARGCLSVGELQRGFSGTQEVFVFLFFVFFLFCWFCFKKITIIILIITIGFPIDYATNTPHCQSLFRRGGRRKRKGKKSK